MSDEVWVKIACVCVATMIAETIYIASLHFRLLACMASG